MLASPLPLQLLEEKEKKTMCMLLVMRAACSDILVGKRVVVLASQRTLSCVVISIIGGFV
jgi:ABC-type Na+ efflux pump permease subunit